VTAEEFKGKYYLATGLEISDEVAVELLKEEGSSWFNKILKMAEPTVWAELEGKYTEVKR
jgi:hypothetical protein